MGLRHRHQDTKQVDSKTFSVLVCFANSGVAITNYFNQLMMDFSSTKDNEHSRIRNTTALYVASLEVCGTTQLTS